MCGIVGYVGSRNSTPILVEGLRKLEYRGYDSAGVAVISNGRIERRRASGKLRNLEGVLEGFPLAGSIGIGHTRWATHGRPSEENAHPHSDTSGQLVVVHNGIIENYLELKERLIGEGVRFETETDTEVVAHLVASYYDGSLERAVARATGDLKGIYSLVFMHNDEPNRLVATRLGPPLVIGLGEGEHFFASDVQALLAHTRRFVYLPEKAVAVIEAGSMKIVDAQGKAEPFKEETISWDPVQAEKGGFRHFMLKEIHEQPRAVRDTLLGRMSLDSGDVHLDEMGEAAIEAIEKAERIQFLACGTSWHAGLIGQFFMEQLAGVPASTDYASEFRYRDPVVSKGTLAVAISQSGETADTLAAMREARSRGASVLAITNVAGSQVTREADGSLLTHAGPEIGVASTKAFTSQVAAIALLAIFLGRRRGALSAAAGRNLLASLARVPQLMDHALSCAALVEEMSKGLFKASDFLFLGRGVQYPIALEGALKLKEISYIHAEGYPAGEMKHGPIALIDESLPVVALIPRGRGYEKILSNVQEVKARGGRVLAVINSGDDHVRRILGKEDLVIEVPGVVVDVLGISEIFSPFVTVIPLQLLAYHVALRAGRDVDQPRNLAKSVTVE
jgi:glucosamine--fructose-6-phosphate aminotransferase (isomerizing)